MEKVMEYTGATKEVAEEVLQRLGGDVVAAIAELSVCPTISGTKFIPPTPKIDAGHDAETLERIRQGRLMADILSASPKNDLRGKATHYPPRAASESVETKQPTATGTESGAL